MLEIIIFLFIIFLVIGILKAIWDALKDVILGILGIGIIIAAIVFLGPIVLSVWPVIIAVLVALFILGCIISFFQKLKYGKQVKELDQIGMKKLSESSSAWEEPKKLGLVEMTASGYVISSRFYKRIIQELNKEMIVTADIFQKHCLRSAASFQTENTTPRLNHMRSQDVLVLLQENGIRKRYLSQKAALDCEHVFELEGAATETEFSAICETMSICSKISVKPEILAKTILNYAVAKKVAHKVELPELGEELFVSDKSKSNSKLVRREISLD